MVHVQLQATRTSNCSRMQMQIVHFSSEVIIDYFVLGLDKADCIIHVDRLSAR